MDEDIRDATSELTLKRLEIQAIRDNTAVLALAVANLSGICGHLEELKEYFNYLLITYMKKIVDV